VRNDVLACTWQKTVDTNNPAGVLSVVLKQGRDWKNLIRPGDALLVFMSTLDGSDRLVPTTVSIVFVDSVVETRAVDGNGATVEAVTVSARDIGKILAESALVSDPAFLAVDQIFYNQELLFKQIERILSPTETILQLLDVFLATPGASELVRTQWRFPGAEEVPIASFLDVSTFVQAPTFGYGIHTYPVAEAGSLWKLLQHYQNADVNEMFVDIRDVTPEALEAHAYQENLARNFVPSKDADEQVREKRRVWNNLLGISDVDRKRFVSGEENVGNVIPDPSIPASVSSSAPRAQEVNQGRRDFVPSRISIGKTGSAALALVFRQRPYDTGTFMKLPHSVVEETELVSSELSKSIHNVMNFFRLHAITLPPQLQELIFGIMVNKESISRFGLRRCEIETVFPFVSNQYATSVAKGRQFGVGFKDVYEYYVWLVSTWHAFNELMLEGSLTMRFRPDIRCGTRLVLRRGKSGGGREELHFYVQKVSHSFAYDPGRSTTNVVLIRGIDANDKENPAASIFWTEKKRMLPVKDPFDYYVNGLMKKAANEPAPIEPRGEDE